MIHAAAGANDCSLQDRTFRRTGGLNDKESQVLSVGDNIVAHTGDRFE